MVKDCAFQYATDYTFTGVKVIEDTGLITYEKAVRMWQGYLPQVIEEKRKGHKPEMVIWVNMQHPTDYREDVAHIHGDTELVGSMFFDQVHVYPPKEKPRPKEDSLESVMAKYFKLKDEAKEIRAARVEFLSENQCQDSRPEEGDCIQRMLFRSIRFSGDVELCAVCKQRQEWFEELKRNQNLRGSIMRTIRARVAT